MTEASVVGHQVHYWPGSYCAARAATASQGKLSQGGGGANPESGIESHLRRWPALREGIGARGRLAMLSRSAGGAA